MDFLITALLFPFNYQLSELRNFKWMHYATSIIVIRCKLKYITRTTLNVNSTLIEAGKGFFCCTRAHNLHTLTKGAFLWGDPSLDQWSRICLDLSGSWCMKGTGESMTSVDLLVPLMHHDPARSSVDHWSELGSPQRNAPLRYTCQLNESKSAHRKLNAAIARTRNKVWRKHLFFVRNVAQWPILNFASTYHSRWHFESSPLTK